ncbi:hypothetical protein INR40_16050, partial [Acinetobacter baumannii]|nr:hypothetical protein [Acinetobacter baumannii]
MNKIPCSVYIVTLNCGAWLERTLQSVSEFDEVIILDSGSKHPANTALPSDPISLNL